MTETKTRNGEVDPEERDELWKESDHRYEARQREEVYRAWIAYFKHLAEVLRARAAEHDERAGKLIMSLKNELRKG